jgi:hypothetical protein
MLPRSRAKGQQAAAAPATKGTKYAGIHHGNALGKGNERLPVSTLFTKK